MHVNTRVISCVSFREMLHAQKSPNYLNGIIFQNTNYIPVLYKEYEVISIPFLADRNVAVMYDRLLA